MEAIIQYGNYPESRGVDKLLEVFVEKYHTTRTKLEKTIEFLNKCLSDDEFCQKFIDDKGYLYEYFLANKGIDGEIEMKFRTDEKFESIDTIKNPLKSILEAYNMQYDVFPKTTPEELFKPAFEQAWKAKKYTLAYRLQMALEQKGIIVNSSKVFTRDDFELASPKLLVWMAQKSAKSDPDMAREANLKVIDEYSDSPFVLEALVTMAKIEEQEKDYAKALVYYEKASQQFYDDPMAPKIVIKIGDLWRAQRQFEKARDQYQTILKTPSWRTGPLQAEALYHIGLSYFDEGLFKEAHGFFERVFVGHSFFASWAIKAYMMDAKTLVKMGALADAKNTLKECLANDSFKSDPQYLEAQELYNNL
jgi:tetratricopeptide (TPR) repeat protein